jgi:ribosome-binding factor A
MNPLHACRLLVLVSISLMVSLSYAADPKVGYQRGLTLGSQGKFAEARAAFEQSLQADPQNTPSRNCLSVLADVQAGRIKDQTAVHLFRAFIDYNLYRTDAAIKELNQAAALDPQYALTYSHRADAYADKGQVDKALAGLESAAGFLRSQLAHRMKLRITPQLHFVYDNTVANGAHLSQLIDAALQGKPAE